VSLESIGAYLDLDDGAMRSAADAASDELERIGIVAPRGHDATDASCTVKRYVLRSPVILCALLYRT
jgi:hypothetical protein